MDAGTGRNSRRVYLVSNSTRFEDDSDLGHNPRDDDDWSYRKRLTLDVVIAKLKKCKGSQFDPELVEVAVSRVAVRGLFAAPLQDAQRRSIILMRWQRV